MITIKQKHVTKGRSFRTIPNGDFFVNRFGDLFVKVTGEGALRIRDGNSARPEPDVEFFPVDVDIEWEYK